MPIVQQGSVNTTALVVPDLYVQIVPPQNLVLNGVPTNVVGGPIPMNSDMNALRSLSAPPTNNTSGPFPIEQLEFPNSSSS